MSITCEFFNGTEWPSGADVLQGMDSYPAVRIVELLAPCWLAFVILYTCVFGLSWDARKACILCEHRDTIEMEKRLLKVKRALLEGARDRYIQCEKKGDKEKKKCLQDVYDTLPLDVQDAIETNGDVEKDITSYMSDCLWFGQIVVFVLAVAFLVIDIWVHDDLRDSFQDNYDADYLLCASYFLGIPHIVWSVCSLILATFALLLMRDDYVNVSQKKGGGLQYDYKDVECCCCQVFV